ncbi:hypothetical protein ME763_32120 [Streptomyces murinus]|uniref:hypothetical protein n=1 Tax=Streptomyces murinus TaxID=33900 RepID=UPI000A1F23ED|nr:hypothetical protein [Streptomyces murinus]WDO09937.1 hypothetical protein ME763_32120 [Streptomyces murinus]
MTRPYPDRDRPARRPAGRTTARRDRTPAAPTTVSSTDPSPVDVRLIGDDKAVRTLVAALQRAVSCGPASYRPSRYSDGTRAYLTVVVPPSVEGVEA